MKKNKPKKFPFVRESKNEILSMMLIFIVAIIIGIITTPILEDLIRPYIEELLRQTENLTGPELTAFIFINNLLASFQALIFGIFFGLMPIFTSLVNGVVLGFVLNKTVQFSILKIWRLFPHGIFELPAVFISLGMGFRLGINYIRDYFNKFKNINFRFFGILSLILGLVGLGIMRLGTTKSIFFKFTLGIILILPFIYLFFIKDKKLRKKNLGNLEMAVKDFIILVVPLLIIAAIIEGILIVVLS